VKKIKTNTTQYRSRLADRHGFASRQTRGFTIIEVLIVLAIAALILLIVFLAVPALQRNSRNNQYRSEASRILAGANEFVANNSGVLPVCPTTYPCNNFTAGSDPATIIALANTKNVTTLSLSTPGTVVAMTPTLNTARIRYGVTCGASGGASVTPVVGPAGSVILVYAVEDADGSVDAQCQGS
jgi:prepilin-type N-terminal cleavage/methylation domain-containing protein